MRIGVAGVGRVGALDARTLDALPDVEVVVADADAGRADREPALLAATSGTPVTSTATRYSGDGHDVRVEVMGSHVALAVGLDELPRSAQRPVQMSDISTVGE